MKDMIDAVPEDLMKEIKKNIRDGASNPKLKWGNALELVHKAYKVANVQRPFPNMKNAWKQYEENLQYAVSELANNRGMDADWRMSSSVFKESLDSKRFRVSIINEGEKKSFTVMGESVHSIEESFVSHLPAEFTTEAKIDANSLKINFYRHQVKQPVQVTIKRL
jgi:hypothetical protein